MKLNGKKAAIMRSNLLAVKTRQLHAMFSASTPLPIPKFTLEEMDAALWATAGKKYNLLYVLYHRGTGAHFYGHNRELMESWDIYQRILHIGAERGYDDG